MSEKFERRLFHNRKEFDEIVEEISSIPRTLMGGRDYLSSLRQRGKATFKDRIRYLIPDSSNFVLDLFNLNGDLLEIDPSFIFDKKGEKVEWNQDRLYEAYCDDEGTISNNSSVKSFIIARDMTQIIRCAIHPLHIYYQEGCNALVYHRYKPRPTRIFTTAIPIQIFKSHLELIK